VTEQYIEKYRPGEFVAWGPSEHALRQRAKGGRICPGCNQLTITSGAPLCGACSSDDERGRKE
jgi:hypothetical protein